MTRWGEGWNRRERLGGEHSLGATSADETISGKGDGVALEGEDEGVCGTRPRSCHPSHPSLESTMMCTLIRCVGVAEPDD
jgi:hypothetical protein